MEFNVESDHIDRRKSVARTATRLQTSTGARLNMPLLEEYKKRRQALEAAFAALDILPVKTILRNQAVEQLTGIDGQDSGVVPARFISDERNALKELEHLKKRATALVVQLNTMHETAIVAMAGWSERQHLMQNLHATIACVTRAIADQQNKTSVSIPRCGRPQDVRAEAVANITAYYFFHLTGDEPTRYNNDYVSSDSDDKKNHGDENKKFSRFVELLQRVFEALDLTQNADHFAKMAIKSFKEKTP